MSVLLPFISLAKANHRARPIVEGSKEVYSSPVPSSRGTSVFETS